MQNSAETTRLFLSTLTEEDYVFMALLVNSEGWIKFIGDRKVHSKAEAVAYIGKILNTKNLYYWVVRIKEENTPIGIISFLKREYLEFFDIGFAFLPEFQGNGYACEATKEILSIVCSANACDPVLATTIPGNVNSIKLLNKLGFHFQKKLEIANQTLHIYSNS
ncbi:GNAT family N-acetyltransferase [Mucilaginibacter arboris]|uniref:GNAT family N-acetyltransferase n=1 Tax=Mucilaginibacter arboris TaxID=2682090 RepID=A0A7K1SU04_9SPHI|nr:GNAT family N-acetyltransferase [Mucilaginibacter arboris]MVN20747.1 GNAT family N-acetyltransferase [Mucilaginibacter arboris]